MKLFGSKRRERTIYFPWERRGIGRALTLPRRQTTVFLLVAAVVGCIFLLHARNKQRRMVRMTRATLEQTRVALDAYRADHAGRCPRDLQELTAPPDHAAYLRSVPVDAWKRPLRFSCPSRQPTRPYDLAADGPDGEPYGLDRIE